MAIILKNNKTYADPHTVTPNTTAYGVVDDLQINKQMKEVRFNLHIYATKEARTAGLRPLATHHITVIDPDFTTHFNPTANARIWTQAYTYLETLVLPGLDLRDWRKDPTEDL